MLAEITRREYSTSVMWPERISIPDWCALHVDFSLSPNYDTPKHERFDPAFMPFWNEPAESLTNPSVREVVVLKCARAGGSENLLLNPIRYAVVNAPQPTLYVTGDQLSAERFMDRRIKRGFRACPPAWKLYRQSVATQHDIALPGCDVRVTWPKARQAFKQDGWALVLCDEVSIWPEYSADMARKRTASYPFSHIVFLSSPDPAQRRASEEDPIFIEHNRGDRRRWMMPDPTTGRPFVFEMGTRDGHGLRWDQSARNEDGAWDMDRVKASAHYITPDGTRIDNAERMRVVRSGFWTPTNTAAPNEVRSYHVTAFMTPFKSGDFGEIAAAFLQAKHRGASAMRTFVYEYLAEPFHERIESTTMDAVTGREAEYARGVPPELPKDTPSSVIIGADVQKAHIWWIARRFSGDGDSALIDYGAAATFDELAAVADKLKASRVMIDCNYRRLETYEACEAYNFVPVEGHDKLSMPYLVGKIDPFEGTRGGGQRQILHIKIHADAWRTLLLDCLRGESARLWKIPRGLPLEYAKQITSMRKVDGQWLQKGPDHLFDCEAYALAGAVWSGAYKWL
jgi:hypothetical protein